MIDVAGLGWSNLPSLQWLLHCNMQEAILTSSPLIWTTAPVGNLPVGLIGWICSGCLLGIRSLEMARMKRGRDEVFHLLSSQGTCKWLLTLRVVCDENNISCSFLNCMYTEGTAHTFDIFACSIHPCMLWVPAWAQIAWHFEGLKYLVLMHFVQKFVSGEVIQSDQSVTWVCGLSMS